MKILVLGTAAATSMPLVFCNCDVCKKSRMLKGKNIRTRSSILINDEFLIDLNPDICTQANANNVDLGKIKYLAITHSHFDHFDATHFITRWSEYAPKNLNHLNVICSKETAEDICTQVKEVKFDIFSDYWKDNMNYDLNLLSYGDEITIGDYKIVGLDSKHDDRIKSLVYIISYKDKNIFYGTDLLKITEESWNILKKYKLDVVFLDQTYGVGFNNGGHLDAQQVSDIVSKMHKESIIDNNSLVYATHISHEGNDIYDEMEKLAIKNNYHIAYDGLKIEI
ncbi:MAG TPA: MBL fold metallo-hydrolase [Bacilli bacterium]|nr:MBL fold metallo-hydrolase [Bacilli bacterium]